MEQEASNGGEMPCSSPCCLTLANVSELLNRQLLHMSWLLGVIPFMFVTVTMAVLLELGEATLENIGCTRNFSLITSRCQTYCQTVKSLCQ